MPKPSTTPSWRTYMRQSKTAKSPKVAKVLHDQALKLRREERAAKATVPAKKGRIYTPKTAKTIPNAGLDKAESWSQEGTGSVTLKATGVAKAAQPGWTAAVDQLYSDEMDMQRGNEARYLPPNTVMGADRAVNADLVTPFDAAFQGIMKAAEVDDVEAVQKLLRDFALYHRNDMERGHIETLKRVHEANSANVVRSYMALIDGLGHASGGPVPPYIVIPGLMAVRVYDALQKAGHSPDGN